MNRVGIITFLIVFIFGINSFLTPTASKAVRFGMVVNAWTGSVCEAKFQGQSYEVDGGAYPGDHLQVPGFSVPIFSEQTITLTLKDGHETDDGAGIGKCSVNFGVGKGARMKGSDGYFRLTSDYFSPGDGEGEFVPIGTSQSVTFEVVPTKPQLKLKSQSTNSGSGQNSSLDLGSDTDFLVNTRTNDPGGGSSLVGDGNEMKVSADIVPDPSGDPDIKWRVLNKGNPDFGIDSLSFTTKDEEKKVINLTGERDPDGERVFHITFEVTTTVGGEKLSKEVDLSQTIGPPGYPQIRQEYEDVRYGPVGTNPDAHDPKYSATGQIPKDPGIPLSSQFRNKAKNIPFTNGDGVFKSRDYNGTHIHKNELITGIRNTCKWATSSNRKHPISKPCFHAESNYRNPAQNKYAGREGGSGSSTHMYGFALDLWAFGGEYRLLKPKYWRKFKKRNVRRKALKANLKVLKKILLSQGNARSGKKNSKFDGTYIKSNQQKIHVEW